MRAVNFSTPSGPEDFQRWATEALREIERASRIDEVTPAFLAGIFTALQVLTAVDKADFVAGYDTSEKTPVQFTVENVFKALSTLTALTAPASGDQVALYDLSATAARGITLANLLKVISDLTEDTAPDAAADYIVTNDTSASGAAKKVLLHRATAFKVGSFTRDMTIASGAQPVTGVGFKPKAIVFLAGRNATSDFSIGFSDGTANVGFYDLTNLGGGFVDQYGDMATLAITIAQSASNIYQGAVASFDSDGFTISWIKNATPTGTAKIYYLALR